MRTPGKALGNHLVQPPDVQMGKGGPEKEVTPSLSKLFVARATLFLLLGQCFICKVGLKQENLPSPS